MLIEFRVSNFRSIREEQKLSLVASNSDKSLPGCVIERDLPGLKNLRYLRAAALYGANASGKTNLFRALLFFQEFVRTSATSLEPGDAIGTEPFKLDRESRGRPSTFELTFVAEGTRYTYAVSADQTRVFEESLHAYPKGLAQKWFHRVYDNASNSYEWSGSSSTFKTDKALREKTRENSLFLSVGPQFGHPQLQPVYNWFKTHLKFINLSPEGGFPPYVTAEGMIKDPIRRSRILSLLKTADLGVTDAEIGETTFSLDEMRDTLPPSFLRILNEQKNESGELSFKQLKIMLAHGIRNEAPVKLDFDEEESAGTRRFFSLLGPWLDTIEQGYTLFIDEIGSSLHPILVRELLRLLFNATKDNIEGQLVFSTHNPLLLDTTLMRRDQVWFTEKSNEGATILYPLTDYRPRNEEALAKGYLAGRYGGIPFIPDGIQS